MQNNFILRMRRILALPLLLILMAIGMVSQGQTVTLDQADLDYAPGETVYITGTEFQPGELVTMTISHIEPGLPLIYHEHALFYATADSTGTFNASWYVEDVELNTTLSLLAEGDQGSLTSVVFTDAGNFEFIETTNTVSLSAGGTGTISVDVIAPKNVGSFTTTLSYTGTAFGTGTNQINLTSPPQSYVTSKDVGATKTFPISISVGSGVADGTYPFVVTATSSSGNPNSKTWSFNVIVGSGSTSGSIASVSAGTQSSSVVYGTANSITYNVTSLRGANGTVNGTYSVEGLPSGVSSSFSPIITFNSSGGNAFPGTTLTLNVPADLAAGTYNFTVWLKEGTSGASTTASLVVGKRPITITAEGKTKFYGDGNPLLTYQITSGGLALTDAFTGSLTRDPGENVGGYDITQGTVALNSNYNLSYISAKLTINKRAVSITADAKSKTYGNSDPALTYQITNGTLAFTDAFTGSLTRDVGEDVGDYDIKQGTVVLSSNYDLSYIGAKFTVDKRPVTITANAKSKTYGDANPALDASVTGTVNGDVLNYSLSTTALQFSGVANSPYPITVSLGVNPNYNVTPHNGELSVTPKAASVTANAKTKTYGDVNPALDASVTGTVNGDVLNYSLATTALQFSGVANSPYPITVSLGDNPNYNVTPHNGELSVTPKDASVTANAKTKTYGDLNPALDALVTGTVNGDALNYSLVTAALQFSGVANSPYPITVSLGVNPNYNVTPHNGELSVTPKDASVTANAKTKTYGDVNPALDASVTGTVNGDVLNYSLATTALQFSGVANSPYPITVSLGDNPNYNVTPHNGELSVTPKDASVTANAKTKTYGDVNPALDASVTGTVNGDILNYSLSTTALQYSGVANSPYPITVSLGVNPNYNVTPHNGELSVTPKDASVTANAKTKTYGDVNPALDASVTGTVNGDVLNYSLSTSALQFSGVANSPYPITVSLGENPNYNVTPHNGELSVTPKDASVTANAKTKTYGDLNPALDASVTGTVNGDVLNYSLATTALQFSGVANSPYPITVSLGDNPNYNVTPHNGELSVTPKDASVTANAKTKTYGDLNPALDASVTGTVNGDALNYSLSTTALQFSGVANSPYPITVSLGENPNYNVTPHNGELSITPKDASVTANDKTKTYGDLNPALDAVVAGTVNGDALNYSLATSALQFSGVGDYDITVSLGDNPNYNVSAFKGKLSVTPKDASVTANAKTKTYGDLNPALDASVAGTVNGDALNYSLATSALQFSGVGDYDITVSLGDNPNYNVSAFKGKLSVTPKDASVTANAKTKTYGDVNPALDALVTGTVNGDILNYSLSTTALQFSGVANSPYDITVSLGDNPNYNVSAFKGKLSVTPKDASVTANAKTKTYGDVNPALDALVTGTVNGDALNYSLATTALQFSGVGDYDITVSLGDNPNYNVSAFKGKLSVTPKDASVTANAKTKTYGDVNPALDALVSGTVNGDVLNYSLATSALQFSGVGDYDITVSLGDNPNYNVSAFKGKLSVTPKDASVTANAKTKTYGDVNPALDASVTGTVNGDVLNYSLSTTALQFSGVANSPYPITVSLGDNPNYNVTPHNGELSVTPKDASVTANAKTKTYGDVNPALDALVTGTVNGDALNYSLATAALQFSGVGDYDITVSLGDNPNYNVSAFKGKLSVTPKDASVTANAKTKTYGDVNPALDALVTGTVNGDALNYSLSTTALQISNVGAYPITVSLGVNPNYTVTPHNGELSVTPKDASVTANAKTKTYGDVNPALDALVTGTVNGDALNYSLYTAALQFSGVGDYDITVSLGDNPNYNVSAFKGKLSVTPKDASVTANAKTKTYGDVNPALDALVTGTVNGDVLYYSLVTAALQFSGVGDYDITVSLGDNPNYNVSAFKGKLSVTPKDASVTANAKTKTYGDVNPALDALVTGTVNGDVLNYSLVTAALQFSGVGDYDITVSLGDNPNYNVSAFKGKLSVTPKDASVTANAKTKTYGDVNPALDALVTGTVNGDVLNYSLATSALQFSGVGDYDITVSLGDNPNYNVSAFKGKLSVTPKDASVTANAKTKTYGDVNPALDASVTGTVNGDVLNYSLSTTALQFSGVGDYDITVSLGDNPNYNVTLYNAVLNIVRRLVTITADAKSKYIGQEDPSLTCTANNEGLVNGDSFNEYLERGPGNCAGNYSITLKEPNNVNYEVTFNKAIFTIKSVSIDASQSSVAIQLGTPSTILKALILDDQLKAVQNISVAFEIVPNLMGLNSSEVVSTDKDGLSTRSINLTNLPTGLYKIVATVISECNVPVTSTAYMTIYDPNGSFITGGGWIKSPTGALTITEESKSLEGKANFGFNAKYKKGKTLVAEVEGNTEFQFQTGNFNFKSNMLSSGTLVISGSKATFRGEGTVNGAGQYGFMVTAVDGQINGGGNIDKFRIKIWDKNTSKTVYDNFINNDENAALDNSTILGGGSIVIHEVKPKSAQITPDASATAFEATLKVYPNPFTEKLNIEFSNATDTKAKLEIYSITGAKLQTLYDGPVTGGQLYNFEYLPRLVSSQVVFYHLTLDGKTQVGKILFNERR